MITVQDVSILPSAFDNETPSLLNKITFLRMDCSPGVSGASGKPLREVFLRVQVSSFSTVIYWDVIP